SSLIGRSQALVTSALKRREPTDSGNFAIFAAIRCVFGSASPLVLEKSGASVLRGLLHARWLQAATSCGSISGKGLAPSPPCGVPTRFGRIQPPTIPAPLLAPGGTNPACLHAAAICAHGPPLFGVG